MSLAYLQQTQAAQANAAGVAVVQLSPDASDFWAPGSIRVSTQVTPQNTVGANASYCAIYHGSISARDAPTSFLDDTYLGSGDSSSAIASTVVQYGEALTIAWQNVTPGDTCIATVYGRSAGSLVELQSVLSPIPGAKFSGNVGGAMLWTPASLVAAGPALAATNGWAFTTSSRLLSEVINVKFKTTSTSTVASRVFGVRATYFDPIQGTTVNLFTSMVDGAFAQVASTVIEWSYSQGQTAYSAGTLKGASIPNRIILPPGTSIALEQVNAAVGDTWQSCTIALRQYRSLAEVSYT